MRMSGRVRTSASCILRESPPTTRQRRTSVNRHSCLPISSHCAASSRVGASTSTRVAAMRRARWRSRSRQGSRKAAVFPDPVTADPQMSVPRSAAGSTAAWIGVGRVYPSSPTALRSGFERSSSKKLLHPGAPGALPCLRLVSPTSGSGSSVSSPSSLSSSSAAAASAAFRFLLEALRSRPSRSSALSSTAAAAGFFTFSVAARALSFSSSVETFVPVRPLAARFVAHLPEVLVSSRSNALDPIVYSSSSLLMSAVSSSSGSVITRDAMATVLSSPSLQSLAVGSWAPSWDLPSCLGSTVSRPQSSCRTTAIDKVGNRQEQGRTPHHTCAHLQQQHGRQQHGRLQHGRPCPVATLPVPQHARRVGGSDLAGGATVTLSGEDIDARRRVRSAPARGSMLPRRKLKPRAAAHLHPARGKRGGLVCGRRGNQ